MVLLGDQPLLTSTTIDMLVGAFAQQQDCWVAPVQEGMRGNPVIIPSTWYEHVLEITGDEEPLQILTTPRLPLRLVRIHEIGPFIDVNTEQQYQRLVHKYETLSA
jgi:molybdenum cofactor cytidylyltransferase